jgi:hypothetical protein
MQTTTGSTQIGRSPEEFSEQAGFSRARLYTIPKEYWPTIVRIGRRVVITESPADWLARMAQRGGVPSAKRVAA